MSKKLTDLWHWFVRHMPEVLLAACIAALAPFLLLAGQAAARQFEMLTAAPRGFFGAVGEHPWSVAAVLVCAVGGAVLIVALWRSWSMVWAVARKVIAEALNRKMVLVLLVFFAVLVVSLPFVLQTEGGLKSQVQIVLLYSLTVSLVLLSLVAIFVATASICSEVERKHVHITDTKPLPRWQFLLGKWVGVVVMCTAALAVMGGVIYLLVGRIAWGGPAPVGRQEEMRLMGERFAVASEVLTARKSSVMHMPNVDAQVEEQVEVYRRESEYKPRAIHSFRMNTRKQIWSQMLTVRPGGALGVIELDGLERRPNGVVHVRFKAYATGATSFTGAWVAFHRQKTQQSEGEGGTPDVLRPAFSVTAPPGGWANRAVHEIALPAEAVSQDGSLYLMFHNATVSPATGVGVSVNFDVEERIEAMQREEGFLRNYYRALPMILFHIALLSALGLMAGSLFSFPVAALIVCCFFIGGLLGPWFSQFVVPDMYANLSPTGEVLDSIWRGFASVVLNLMPDFGNYSPLGSLVSGRMVTWGQVARAGAVLFFLKGGGAMLIAMYFYARRELARVVA